MKPTKSKPASPPRTREERRHLIIDFLAFKARRDRPELRKRLADAEARLVAAGVDPWWSPEEFRAWTEEGE